MDENTTDRQRADWVSERLQDLVPSPNCEPDAARALARLSRSRLSPRDGLRVWRSIAVAAVCLLALALVRREPGLPSVSSTANAVPETGFSEEVVFEAQDTLVLPDDYRDWIFVGSSLGLGYPPGDGPEGGAGSQSDRPDLFQNVYMNPSAYREFLRTGKFPDGTMMILEISSAETPSEPGLAGTYPGRLVAVEASVKDSSRFEGGWGYFGFSDRGQIRTTAKPLPTAACWSCHDEHAETDHVFTQFYPVLRSARSG
jgi:hypothetical protein